MIEFILILLMKDRPWVIEMHHSFALYQECTAVGADIQKSHSEVAGYRCEKITRVH